MREQTYTDRTLIRPADEFWPMRRYHDKFGSLSGAAQKKLRHRKCIIDGIKGVTVPGDAGDGPWRLEHRSGVRIEKDNEEDVGSTDGEEEAANDKFNMLRAQQETTHAAIAQGALAAVLKTFVLSPEDLEKEKQRARRTKLTRGRKARQPASASNRPERREFLSALASDDDSDDGFSEPAKPTRRTQPPRKGTWGKRCAAAPKPPPTEGGGEGVEEESLKGKRGAPSKDCLAMEAKMWAEFQLADEASLYFCSVSNVQRRLLARWSTTARAKAGQASGPDKKQAFEECAKRLQIMENITQIHRAWMHARASSSEKAFLEVDASWKVLQSFATSAPSQRIDCCFWWDFRTGLQATCP